MQVASTNVKPSKNNANLCVVRKACDGGPLAGWFSKPCLLVLCCIFEETSLLAFWATRMFGLASKENAFAVVRQREGALLQAITKGEASSSRVTSCEVCPVPNSCLKRLRERPPQAGPSLPVPHSSLMQLQLEGPPPGRATSSEVCPVPHSFRLHYKGGGPPPVSGHVK